MAPHDQKQKIIMFTGKGGVGKSTIAAAYALKQSELGKKTLLVEIGDQSYFKHIFGVDIGYESKSVRPNLSVSMWSGVTCLKEYVSFIVKIKKLADLFFENRVMKTFIRAAPALKELAIVGKITSGVRSWGPPMPYDLVVVDALSTGHFLALLRAPIGMSELIKTGPMGQHSREMVEVLSNNQKCEYVICTLPEELPSGEAVELSEELRKLTGQEARIVCNKYYNPAVLKNSKAKEESPNDPRLTFRGFLERLVNNQARHLEFLDKRFKKVNRWPLVLNSEPLSVLDELKDCEL